MALFALALAMFTSPFRAARDIAAVRSARTDLVTAAARARSLAVGHGGAELHIDTELGTVQVLSGDSAVREQHDLGSEFGVVLAFRNTSATRAVLRYDGLGIGRLASRTIAISRGGTEAGVTFSAYGRAREW